MTNIKELNVTFTVKGIRVRSTHNKYIITLKIGTNLDDKDWTLEETVSSVSELAKLIENVKKISDNHELPIKVELQNIL